MTLSVIGAGFGRTGTMSLKHALEQLGFGPCYHMDQVIPQPQRVAQWLRVMRGEPSDWSEVFAGYGAAVDWPACTFWPELMHRYPEAKIILSLRDANDWYDSVMKTILPASDGLLAAENPMFRPVGEFLHELIWDGTFDGRIRSREHAVAVFEAHNARVKKLVPASRLLVFEPSEGWPPLCKFLGVEVPETAYPRANTREDYVGALKRAGIVRDSG